MMRCDVMIAQRWMLIRGVDRSRPPGSGGVSKMNQEDSHQQAGLAAGTVADDDQLSAQLGGHFAVLRLCGWCLKCWCW